VPKSSHVSGVMEKSFDLDLMLKMGSGTMTMLLKKAGFQ